MQSELAISFFTKIMKEIDLLKVGENGLANITRVVMFNFKNQSMIGDIDTMYIHNIILTNYQNIIELVVLYSARYIKIILKANKYELCLKFCIYKQEKSV